MRDDQQQIAEWLSTHAPQLESVYRGAVRLLGEPNFPGRVHFICHAGRDIANRAPDLVGGKMDLQRLDVGKDLDKLRNLWSRFSLDQRGPAAISIQEDGKASSLKEDIRVPIAVIKHIGMLLSHYEQTTLNHRERATKMLETIAPENKGRQEALYPIANQWIDLTRWFVRHAHAGHKLLSVSEEELQNKFSTLENHLATLISTSFYGPVDILDEILEDTNS